MAKKGEYKKNAKPNSIRQRKYNSSSTQKKNRVARNKARRKGIRSGRVSKGDDKVLDHIIPIVKGGSRNGKVRVRSKKSSQRQGGKLRRR